MKYLFGDSTEFTRQIDFLGLLENFMDTSVKVITLENTVFDLKETVMDRRRLKNSVLDEMDNFHLTVQTAIEGAVAKSREQETIVKYAEKSKDFLRNYIEDGKKKLSDDIFHEIAQFEEKIDGADEENRKTLESFFIQDPIPIINKIYTIKVAEKGYSAKVQEDCEGNITCVFEIALSDLPFWKGHVKAHEFVKGIDIPARMRKPFLKKDLVPDIVSMDDYILDEIILSEKELEVVFRKRLDAAAERFRLKMNFGDDFSAGIYHADEKDVEKNIMAIPELRNEVNILRLRELGENIVMQTNSLFQKRKQMEVLTLAGKDVFEENLIFELMQKVAEILAPAISEIKNRSPSEDELSLKAEDETGQRSEIYLKKSQAKEKLSSLKEKGEKLFEILGI